MQSASAGPGELLQVAVLALCCCSYLLQVATPGDVGSGLRHQMRAVVRRRRENRGAGARTVYRVYCSR
jgi:hypothetical protein